jgi:oligosaccharide repeat unit polymerase
VAGIALAQSIGSPSLDRDWPELVTVVWLIWTVVYIVASWRALETPYLLSSAYLIALCVFHLGLPIPAAFGWLNVPEITRSTDGFWLQQSAWCTLLALGMFGVGFALSIKIMNTASDIDPMLAGVMRSETLATIFWAGLGLLVAAGCFLVMLILQVGNLLTYSRMDLFHYRGDTRGLALFMMTLPSAAVLLVIGAHTLVQKIVATSVACTSLGIFLLSGYRSAALFPLLVGTILWSKTGRRIPMGVAVAMVGVIVVAIPAVAILRASGTYEDLSGEKVSESIEKADTANTFVELGGTAGILAATLKLVPDSDPFRYGLTYVYALREAIPNIDFAARQSDRDVFLKRGATRDAMIDLTPSDWLTYKLEPIKFSNGEGVGFSAIAEPYLNFGYPGVMACFIIMGFLLGRLDQKILWAEPRWLLFCGAVFWPLVRTVRNDLNNFTKPLVFLYLILGVWFVASSFLRRFPSDSSPACEPK